MKFVIEHLDSRLYAWCFLEYKHIAKSVGKGNALFTNIRRAADRKRLSAFAKVEKRRAEELNLGRVCVLDPEAKVSLKPRDKDRFDSFLFGGILGDCPMQGRTRELLTSRIKGKTRNLGPEQMSTDTAVIVTKLILQGKPLKSLSFQNTIEIPIKEGESVELPFRYLLVDGKPLLPPGLVEHLKHRHNF